MRSDIAETQISNFSKTKVSKKDEIAEKTSRLQRMLEREGLGGVIISGQCNFAWLTAGGSNGVDTSREPGVASLLVRSDGRRYVLANRIEMPRLLAEEISDEDFEPIEFSWEEEKADPDFLTRRAQSLLSDRQTLGSDVSAGACKTVEAAIAGCRYQLTSGDLDRFRSLGADAGRVIAEVARRVEPGQTERAVAIQVADALAEVNIRAVVMLVAADQRIQTFRHPLPTDLAWKKALMIVVCARRKGLIASLTRIVTAGAVPEDLRSRTDAVARVNGNLLAGTRRGITGAELYQIAARSYAAVGFPGEERLHHQGGACGYRTRDWVAHPASTDVVHDRQAFAWNPSITGTKVEETVLLLSERLETITSSPDWPQIPINVNGREFSSPDVLPL